MKSKTSIYLKHDNPDIQGQWHILATRKKETDKWFEDKHNIARYCSIEWAE